MPDKYDRNITAWNLKNFNAMNENLLRSVRNVVYNVI